MAIDIDALRTELIAGHPDTLAYNADAEIAAGQLNAVNRTLPIATLTASEVFNAFDPTEFTALTNAEEAQIFNLLAFGELNPFGHEATIFIDVFGPDPSTTIQNLNAIRTRPVSRAEEIGLGFVKVGYVEQARA